MKAPPFTPEELARALGGRIVGRNRVRAPSPGMPPTDESLEIKFDPQYADGFTVNDYYGGGDDWQSRKDYVRKACGKPWEPSQKKEDPVQRMNARAKDKREKRAWGPVVKTYDYTEADGTVLFRVCRHDPKNFHQEMPDGNGGWTKSMEGMRGRHVLYIWPGIVKFPDATIFVVEGEKDADRLASLGHTATTITGSATWTEDCIAPLRGRHIIVMEDNDEKGRKRAGNAARALHGHAASLRYVRFPDLPEGGDVSDWLDANNNDIETLVDMCLATPEWRPDSEEPLSEEQPAADPVDLWGKFDPPSLPRGVLPDILERFAVEQGRDMGADIAGVAVSALAVCAAAIPDKIKLQVKRHNTGWQEAARIWVAPIGLPSTKKTPIMAAAVRPLRKIDSEMARQYAEERARYDKLPKEEKVQANPPKHTRVMLQDTTIEAAQEVLKDSPDGVLCFQDELAGWFGSMEKYSSGKGGAKDRAFWLEAFNGGQYSVNRIGRGSARSPAAKRRTISTRLRSCAS